VINKAAATHLVPAPPRAVFSLLADYRAYPEWCPEVESARLLAREGDVAVVELRVPAHIAQPVVLEMVQTPERSLMFTQVDRYRTQGLAGRLELSAEAGGQTRVRGELAIGAPAYRLGCRRRLRQALDGVLLSLAEQVAPQETREEAPPEARTLLEVRRSPQGLEVIVGPRRFRFPEPDPR
jgi:hypothetical protein